MAWRYGNREYNKPVSASHSRNVKITLYCIQLKENVCLTAGSANKSLNALYKIIASPVVSNSGRTREKLQSWCRPVVIIEQLGLIRNIDMVYKDGTLTLAIRSCWKKEAASRRTAECRITART